MKKRTKKFWDILLSMAMVFSTVVFTPADFQKTVLADAEESFVTDFSYDFAYTTPGYADGTIRINATEDGVYKVFWGDAEGNKLTKNGYEYSYLARVIVKDGKGSFNIISDYTAIPEGAKTVLVYRKDAKQFEYDIPESKLFIPEGDSYTFGAISDLHFGRYTTTYDDDAVPAVDNALNFLAKAGVKFVGTTGDLTAGGEQTSLDKYNAALAKHPEMTVLLCTGNHDSRTTVSNTDKKALDTSIIRWYNSLTSKYFSVGEDGTITSNLKGHDVLASDALTNPITTEYRESAGADALEKTIPGLDFVTEAGGNIYIFFNEIAKTGETYKVDDLLTTGQMDWLAEQLETYKDKKVFVFFHSYLAVNTLNNDAVDNNNSTGDLKSDGGYSYNLDFKDSVTTTNGLNMQALFNKYSNVTMFSGHSHWQYAMQSLNANLNIGRLKSGEGATLVHLASVTEPRYVGKDDTARTELNGQASEGSTVTTYNDCTIYNGVDFYNSQYEAYATYIIPEGAGSKYQPVKNPNYKESTDAITGDEYLEPEDMTNIQLLKSNYNLLLGAGYVYSSKGSNNKDKTLTDGSSIGDYLNTKENKNADQYVIVTLYGEQEVSNLKNFMLYFVNGLTDCSSFNIQLSQDGENYETVGTYTNMTYKTTTLDVDTSKLTIDKYKYVKLNLTGGSKAYGYQIREFAAIGYERNATLNTAGSESSLVEGVVDEEDFLDSDYNLVYGTDYTQSSVGIENVDGKLTDGKITGGVANTERSSSAQNQNFIIDLGKSKIQNVSNIDYFLLYFQNEATNATVFNVSVSLDGETYETVGKYTNVGIDTNHFDPDLTDVTLEQFRYIKLNLTAGKTLYGYQVKEFGVIGKKPIEYPEIADQSSLVSSNDAQITITDQDNIVYTGKSIEPEVTVTYRGKTLTKDIDYSVSYDNNINAGTSKYKVTGKGNYTGTVEGEFTIAPKNLTSEDVAIDDSALKAEMEFTGKEITPDVKISFNEQQLKADKDFTIKYENNTNPGEATITITGVGNYTGEIVKAFSIVKKPMKNVMVSTSFDSSNELVVIVKNGNDTMEEGKDYTYEVVTDKEGNIAITFTALGNNYYGSFVKTIPAEQNPNRPRKSLNDSDIVVDDSNLKETLEFNGKDRTPIVVVKYNGTELSINKDFMAGYTNNFYPGTATVTITGIGGYKGEIIKHFTITKKLISNVTIRTSFNTAKQLVVTVNNGSYGMKKDKDYSYTVVSDAEGNITITFTGLGQNYTGTYVKKILAADNPNRPVPPTVKTAKIKKAKNLKGKKVMLTWKKISNVTGYQIKYAANKKLKKSKIKTVKKNVTKYTIKKLKKNKKYYFKIRAYKVYNGKNYYGKWSTKKNVIIKK